MSEFSKALDSIQIKITKYDPSKARPIYYNRGSACSYDKFSERLRKDLSGRASDFPEVFLALHDGPKFFKMFEDHAKEKGVLVEEETIEIPPGFEDLTLNMDLAAGEMHFFVTNAQEHVSPVSGNSYVKIMQLKENDAVAKARKVFPEYLPREGAGVFEIENEGETRDVFNIYVPPAWHSVKEKLPDKLPELFEKLVRHLFPLAVEREFFYSWLYYSLFERAFVYLVLCGAPGTGKNRLKLVMRALHGHLNTIDGKRSTLTEKFNSQLAGATLAWFDELRYDIEMENTMKELQNDSISIERKGVDATRSTRIHASLAISNNKPRDNYISFDSRKFVPLALSSARLETNMTPKEIDTLTKKVENPQEESFDLNFIAQIARWLERRGKSPKWPNLEYRGPMFYKLAHTSMSRWQKKAAELALELGPADPLRYMFDVEKGFRWSILETRTTRRGGDRNVQFPDYTSAKYFFDIFVDDKGRKAFKTENIPDNIMGDFWVKSILKKTVIISEAQVMGEINGAEKKRNHGKDAETYDL